MVARLPLEVTLEADIQAFEQPRGKLVRGWTKQRAARWRVPTARMPGPCGTCRVYGLSVSLRGHCRRADQRPLLRHL